MTMFKSLRTNMRTLKRDESGVAAVEFALASTMLILLLVGATDLGLAMRHKSQLEAATRAGMERALADAGENELDLAAVEETVEEFVGLPSGGSLDAVATSFRKCVLVDEDGGTVTENDPDAAGYCDAEDGEERYTFVNVSVSQSHAFLFDIPGIDNPLTMSISMDVKVPEQQ